MLFGFTQGPASRGATSDSNEAPTEGGNAHSGPGGYEGMGYLGGYAADYRTGQDFFDAGYEDEA